MTTISMPYPTALSWLAGLANRGLLHVVKLARAYQSRRDLQLLASFDDRMLQDIGLSRGDLRDAAAEPLWRDASTVLVKRARERRRMRGKAPMGPCVCMQAPPTVPEIDTWSATLFPARSRYY